MDEYGVCYVLGPNPDVAHQQAALRAGCSAILRKLTDDVARQYEFYCRRDGDRVTLKARPLP